MQGKKNDYWYTPEYVLKPVREFLGHDYFDPCPINPTFDGLAVEWKGNCFLNPPYSSSLLKAFINKAFEEYKPGRVYLWLLNFSNSEYTRELREKSSGSCIPSRRIQFVPGLAELGDGKSPMYDNIFYVWGDTYRLYDCFDKIGDVFERAI